MRTLACDTETTGLDLYHDCRPFFVTMFCGKEPMYWQWKVDPATRRVQVVKEDLLEIAEWLDRADEVVFHNSKFDIRALIAAGLKWKQRWWAKCQDTLYSGHLLSSAKPLNLTDQALEYLGVDIQPLEDRLEEAIKAARAEAKALGWKLAKEDDPGLPSLKGSKGKKEAKSGKADRDKKGWKWDMWVGEALAEFKGLLADHPYRTTTVDYANGDSRVTYDLWLTHKQLVQDAGLWPLYEESRKLIKVVYDMESRGVTCNDSRLDELLLKYGNEGKEKEAICCGLSNDKLTPETMPAGGSINNLVREVLFEDFKLPVVKLTESGKPSADKEAVAEWQLTLPPRSRQLLFVNSFARRRKCGTTVGFLNAYKRFGVPCRGGWLRLHPSLKITGTGTLRGSSENPNSQNISKQKDEELGFPNIRYCFGPMPGREWWSADFKNLEQVIPAYESGEQLMIDLFEKPDEAPLFGSYHLLNCSIVYPEEFQKCVRNGWDFKSKYKSTLYQWIKNMGFAILYGAIEKEDGWGTADKAAHKRFAHKMVKRGLSRIEDLNQRMIAHANRYGFVETIPDKSLDMKRGYQLYCPRGNYGKVLETTPLNYHVSGTAMWCTRKAMRRCGEYLSNLPIDAFITMQVHDELVFDLPAVPNGGNAPIARKLKLLMEESGRDIGIPIAVDLSYHPDNWADDVEYPEESLTA